MEVHIKRRHRGMDLALNNPYGAINAKSFGYPNYNLKPSYSLSNVAFHDEESVRRQTNRGDRQEDSMDHFIDLLSKQAQIKDLTSQLYHHIIHKHIHNSFTIPALWVNSCKDRATKIYVKVKPALNPNHFS